MELTIVLLNILSKLQHVVRFTHLDFPLRKQSLLMVIWATFIMSSLHFSNLKLISYTL